MNSIYYPEGSTSMQKGIEEYFKKFPNKEYCEVELERSILGDVYYSACSLGISKEVNESIPSQRSIGVWRIKLKK